MDKHNGPDLFTVSREWLEEDVMPSIRMLQDIGESKEYILQDKRYIEKRDKLTTPIPFGLVVRSFVSASWVADFIFHDKYEYLIDEIRSLLFTDLQEFVLPKHLLLELYKFTSQISDLYTEEYVWGENPISKEEKCQN